MKKAQLDPFSLTLAIIAGIIFLFLGTGAIKFLLQDKTPYIIGGIFILLILFSRKRRQGGI